MKLTRRELDILKFLASGFTNAQIANILGVHYRIIAAQLETIWRKLDCERSEPRRIEDALESS
jgi:DNA-binding CsgD family transcriptional regulator